MLERKHKTVTVENASMPPKYNTFYVVKGYIRKVLRLNFKPLMGVWGGCPLSSPPYHPWTCPCMGTLQQKMYN